MNLKKKIKLEHASSGPIRPVFHLPVLMQTDQEKDVHETEMYDSYELV